LEIVYCCKSRREERGRGEREREGGREGEFVIVTQITKTYIYIYIYMYVCMYVCIYTISFCDYNKMAVRH